MKLNELIESGFERFNKGRITSLAITDRESETLQIVDVDKTNTIKQEYLPLEVLSVSSRMSMPTRLRLKIDYLER